jgi:co-chaperonin GroES (HSP10)
MTKTYDGLILPPSIRATLEKVRAAEPAADVDEERGKKLPTPVGYKMLLILPESEATFESGIAKADSTRAADEVASAVAFVAAQGPDCYKDAVKFPTGAWCKPGDFVVIRPYSGVRVVVCGKEMRLVNDDSIEAIVDDPRGIKRVGG